MGSCLHSETAQCEDGYDRGATSDLEEEGAQEDFIDPSTLEHRGEGEGLGVSKGKWVHRGYSPERRIFEVENHHMQRPEMNVCHGWAAGVWERLERHLGHVERTSYAL